MAKGAASKEELELKALKQAQSLALARKKFKLQRLRDSKAARTADTRRKILIGAVVLNIAKKEKEIAALLSKWLDEGLVNERDRQLFDGFAIGGAADNASGGKGRELREG